MLDYILKGTIGEGQFGSVYLAYHKSTNKDVAIKLIRVNKLSNGIPHPITRECMIACMLRHPNVVITYSVETHGSFLALVMERCAKDLATILFEHSCFQPLSMTETRSYFRMLLKALYYIHSLGILHRDVKPSNCYITSDGRLKLGDFGLSRLKDTVMTHEVVSRWYRAPELLFGCRSYGEEIDIWAAGCVFAEMLRGYGSPLFAGDGDIDQLSRIFDILGTPTAENWPGVGGLPDWDKVQFEYKPRLPLKDFFPRVDSEAIDLLGKLLTLNPKDRPSAEEALRHPFFFVS